MIVGIVGSEAAKFTPVTEELGKNVITDLLMAPGVVGACSGACHLGGIDIWTEEIAFFLNLPFVAFPPKTRRWAGGYRERNMEIAVYSKRVTCITLRTLPKEYKGMRFDYCYHCGTNEHVKSGGCWTVKYAKSIGKQGEVIVI